MQPVTGVLTEECQNIQWQKLKIPYICNSKARRAWNNIQVREDLAEGAEKVVRWYDGITLMKELGIETFIEASPSHILTDIGQRSWPELRWLTSQSAAGKYGR